MDLINPTMGDGFLSQSKFKSGVGHPNSIIHITKFQIKDRITCGNVKNILTKIKASVI